MFFNSLIISGFTPPLKFTLKYLFLIKKVVSLPHPYKALVLTRSNNFFIICVFGLLFYFRTRGFFVKKK